MDPPATSAIIPAIRAMRGICVTDGSPGIGSTGVGSGVGVIVGVIVGVGVGVGIGACRWSLLEVKVQGVVKPLSGYQIHLPEYRCLLSLNVPEAESGMEGYLFPDETHI